MTNIRLRCLLRPTCKQMHGNILHMRISFSKFSLINDIPAAERLGLESQGERPQRGRRRHAAKQRNLDRQRNAHDKHTHAKHTSFFPHSLAYPRQNSLVLTGSSTTKESVPSSADDVTPFRRVGDTAMAAKARAAAQTGKKLVVAFIVMPSCRYAK